MLDVRYGGEEADRLQVWLRTVSALPDGAALHAAVLAYASDLTILGTALRPHGIGFENPELITASIDHAMWFHRPARADEWLLYVQSPVSTHGSRGLAEGKLEYKGRGDAEAQMLPLAEIGPFLKARLCAAP